MINVVKKIKKNGRNNDSAHGLPALRAARALLSRSGESALYRMTDRYTSAQLCQKNEILAQVYHIP